MPTPPVRLSLAPGTTAHQLMAQGMPESSAYQALKRGWYCPAYNQRAYPQLDGPGGFATIETPERFVRAYVLRTLAQWEIASRRDLVEDLTQGRVARLLDPASCPAYPALSTLLCGDAARARHAALQAAQTRAGAAGAAPGYGGPPCCA